MSDVWNLNRLELDVLPPRDPRLPIAGYIVCATPRSGSGLLCRGLASTGMGGAPAEYFNEVHRVPLSARWRTGPDPYAFARALRARRTSAAGVFGIKVLWGQLELLEREVARRSERQIDPDGSAALLDEFFPGSTYIQIRREDVNRQAVSLWTALQTGVWSARASIPLAWHRGVRYSFSGIRRQRALILVGNEGWKRAFARAGIEPIVVIYEDLVASYGQTIASVLERATGQSYEAGNVAPPESRKLGGDPRSGELLAFFERDLERFLPARLAPISDVVANVRERLRAATSSERGSL